MHLFFSGIGGTGLGPLALAAKKAGFSVSGSDKQDSQYISYLKKRGLTDIHIGQTKAQIAKAHLENPIDWFIYSSAVSIENPNSEELRFCQDNNIKASKRDELINYLLEEKSLELIAIAGTHGKTTTTAMVIWLFSKLGIPTSYSVGAKINFGDMGEYQEGSKYFIYEADEFDRNFLAFEPRLSLITGVSWDHHEIFRTREDYQQAFQEFIGQSKTTILWGEDSNYLGQQKDSGLLVQNSSNPSIQSITLKGIYNRLDAWLAVQALHYLTKRPIDDLIKIINDFPGSQRRMEQIISNLYSDYAHTPEKIRGAMSVAMEMAADKNQEVVVIYEPLTNRRQHYIYKDYGDSFEGAKKVYWLPSYLARENSSQKILSPTDIIEHLSDPSIAEPTEQNQRLKDLIQNHLDNNDLVVAMSGGGGGSLDEWLRKNFKS